MLTAKHPPPTTYDIDGILVKRDDLVEVDKGDCQGWVVHRIIKTAGDAKFYVELATRSRNLAPMSQRFWYRIMRKGRVVLDPQTYT